MLTEPTRQGRLFVMTNDTVNIHFPECPSCGASPGRTHDPECPVWDMVETEQEDPEDFATDAIRRGYVNLFDLMLQYSEYLDSQGLIVDPRESRDQRTHNALVETFLAEWTEAQTEG